MTNSICSCTINTVALPKKYNCIIECIQKICYGYKSKDGYGDISDPYTYCNEKYGEGWSLDSYNHLSVTPLLQNNLESNANNCTLSAITMIFDYHRKKGQSGIPSNINTLYSDVQTIAKKYGYTAEKGTDFSKIDNIE